MKSTTAKPVRPAKRTLGAKKRKPKVATTKPRRKQPDARRWYVVAVDTGTDAKVRRGIIRKKKIEGLEKKIGRVLSPIQLKEEIIQAGGKVILSGHTMDPTEAKETGNLKAWEYVKAESWQVDKRSCPPGYRVRINPAKSQTKGKVGNGWDWVVKEELSMEKRKILRRERKFPGYLLIHMKMDEETFHVVKGVRGVMYFLMSDEKPTELDSEEACRVLIDQTEQNKIIKAKQKEGIKLDYAVGDEVVGIDGAWKNSVGIVTKIEGSPPVITVEFKVWNMPVSVSLNHLEVKKHARSGDQNQQTENPESE